MSWDDDRLAEAYRSLAERVPADLAGIVLARAAAEPAPSALRRRAFGLRLASSRLLAAAATISVAIGLASVAILGRPNAPTVTPAASHSAPIATPEGTLPVATSSPAATGTPLRSVEVAAFADLSVAADLVGLAIGSDGAAYVLDGANGIVWRVAEGTTDALAWADADHGRPRLIAAGGTDILVLDEAGALWRHRPAGPDRPLPPFARVMLAGSDERGDAIVLGTFVRSAELNLYNAYVVDPSDRQILVYSPAADGSGYPAAAVGRLAEARDVSAITDLVVDGDLFVADGGVVRRFLPDEEWSAGGPGADPIPATFTVLATGTPRREGTLLAFDDERDRIVALSKSDGTIVATFVAEDGAWSGLRDLAVDPGSPDVLWWIDRDHLYRTLPAPGADPAPATVLGLPILSVAELADRQPGEVTDEALAVQGWLSRPDVILDCFTTPLTPTCEHLRYVLGDDPAAPARTLAPVLLRDVSGAIDGLGSAPVPVILIGHLRDHRADAACPESVALCRSFFIVDRVLRSGERADGVTPTWGDPSPETTRVALDLLAEALGAEPVPLSVGSIERSGLGTVEPSVTDDLAGGGLVLVVRVLDTSGRDGAIVRTFLLGDAAIAAGDPTVHEATPTGIVTLDQAE